MNASTSTGLSRSWLFAAAVALLPLHPCAAGEHADTRYSPPPISEEAQSVIVYGKDNRVIETWGRHPDGRWIAGVPCSLCTQDVKDRYVETLAKAYREEYGAEYERYLESDARTCERWRMDHVLTGLLKRTEDVERLSAGLQARAERHPLICSGTSGGNIEAMSANAFFKATGSHYCWYYLEQNGNLIYEMPAGCSKWGH